MQVTVNPILLTIRVEDDGCGIPASSFGTLAVCHATSKLRSLKGLDKGVSTLGFR